MIKKMFILPIRLYQIFISPVIGGNRCCRFAPSCSNYAIEAIQELGVIKGLLLSAKRILRCNPWGRAGYDPVNLHIKNKSKIEN